MVKKEANAVGPNRLYYRINIRTGDKNYEELQLLNTWISWILLDDEQVRNNVSPLQNGFKAAKNQEVHLIIPFM